MSKLELRNDRVFNDNKLTLSVSNSKDSVNLVSQLLVQAGYRPFNPQNGNLCLVSDRTRYPFGIELLTPEKIVNSIANNRTDLGIILSADLQQLPAVPNLEIVQMNSKISQLTVLCNSADYPEEVWRQWTLLTEPFKKTSEKIQSTGVIYF